MDTKQFATFTNEELLKEKEKKVLDKSLATSIMIPVDLMRRCSELTLLTTNRDNEYHHVKRTNLAIAHIEEDFCCLVNYKVTTVTNPEELQSLPHLLSATHFAVYQRKKKNGGSRDWIETSSRNIKIGYMIKYLIHGEGCKLMGQTLDHLAETYNELDGNTEFTYNNPNDGSHRYVKYINTMVELLEYIEALREYEGKGGHGFIFDYEREKKRRKRKQK